jgi:hypothetical protein
MGRAGQRSDTHRMRVLTAPASEYNSVWSVIVPADGTRAAIAGKRRLRYVCVFWAALGQAGACSYLMTWGAGRKAQWLVEIKCRAPSWRSAGSPIDLAAGGGKRFEFSRAARPSRRRRRGSVPGRADVSTADPANCCDCPHMTQPPTEAASNSPLRGLGWIRGREATVSRHHYQKEHGNCTRRNC